ncbi:MAG: hypothetical protein KKF44_00770 [Nanoarchaeota archaeon]|nr:hypothetical protein [Nanoarchaeota archaeon]
MKKAQAAPEFLLTYGWAILAVIVSIGALAYFGVINHDNAMPGTCIFPSGATCLDSAVIDSEADTIELALKNTFPGKIFITGSAKVSDHCTGAATVLSVNGGAPSMEIDTNGNMLIKISCPGIEKGKFKADIRIGYTNILTFSEKEIYGSITGMAR